MINQGTFKKNKFKIKNVLNRKNENKPENNYADLGKAWSESCRKQAMTALLRWVETTER